MKNLFKPALAAGVAALVIGLGCAGRSNAVCLEGLKFNGIGPRRRRNTDELQGTVNAAIVVNAGLGNDEGMRGLV